PSSSPAPWSFSPARAANRRREGPCRRATGVDRLPAKLVLPALWQAPMVLAESCRLRRKRRGPDSAPAAPGRLPRLRLDNACPSTRPTVSRMDVALVTGAATGVGLAVERKLVDLGCRVYGLGGNYQDTPFRHPAFLPVACDLASPADVQEK